MSLNNHAIGKRIMLMRKKNNLSQMRLAELIDKSHTSVSYIETGKMGMSLETFVKIANTLYASADILLAEQLTGSIMAASQEITILLADCNDFERFVIIDTLKSIKVTLREYKPIMGDTNR
ncbi:helix-turn-helix domain-containing protein [Christensenellaceae bacterium OttesenSCG-928-K19]|nr:helix-turn-helix domain-containing protein [Christensenellaceae bacterium OttesenSCG-928-K19]